MLQQQHGAFMSLWVVLCTAACAGTTPSPSDGSSVAAATAAQESSGALFTQQQESPRKAGATTSSATSPAPATDAARVAPVPTNPPPSSQCGSSQFWDGSACQPKQLEFGTLSYQEAMDRCAAGDDQACPLAIDMQQHDCYINVQSACDGAAAARQRWMDRRDEVWGKERCAIGQYAGCYLFGLHQKRLCLDDSATGCARLAALIHENPDLSGPLDVGHDNVLLRACDLGHQPSCPATETQGTMWGDAIVP